MDDNLREAILNEYSSNLDLYESCASEVKRLIGIYAKKQNIMIHALAHRTKKIKSLAEKLGRAGKDYKSIGAITDLAGIRVTTYFPNDVDKIAAIIEKEFAKDEDNSEDKRKYEDPSKFGYASLHLVCEFNEASCARSEYEDFKGIKFEIQIRSILQHAWAEIEHDRGYKNKDAMPKMVRRKFSRLAGLLETADDLFEEIRTELDEYEKGVSETIEETPQSVEIDSISLKSLIASDQLIHSIDRDILEGVGAQIRPEDPYFYARWSIELGSTDLRTIDEVQRSLVRFKTRLAKFALEYMRFPSTWRSHTLPLGISINYLIYALIIENNANPREAIMAHLNALGIEPEPNRENAADRLMSAWEASNT